MLYYQILANVTKPFFHLAKRIRNTLANERVIYAEELQALEQYCCNCNKKVRLKNFTHVHFKSEAV